MARSNSSTRNTSRTSSRTQIVEREETPVRSRRNITYYTFDYQRDRVSRRAGSSYFQIAGRNGVDQKVTMTLQEAQSLYRFLQGAFEGTDA